MAYIAFKKKTGGFFETLVSFFTKSPYVHCELVSVKDDKTFFGYTSDPSEGGVTARRKSYNQDDWEFRKVNITAAKIKEFYEPRANRKYDWLGCLGIVFGNPDNPKRYFCSEFCAECLGLENPSKFSPGSLRDKIIAEENLKNIIKDN